MGLVKGTLIYDPIRWSYYNNLLFGVWAPRIHQPPIGIVSGCVPHQWCITPAWNQPRPSDHHYILQIINLKDKSMLGVLFQLTILCDVVACWSPFYVLLIFNHHVPDEPDHKMGYTSFSDTQNINMIPLHHHFVLVDCPNLMIKLNPYVPALFSQWNRTRCLLPNYINLTKSSCSMIISHVPILFPYPPRPIPTCPWARIRFRCWSRRSRSIRLVFFWMESIRH